MKMPGRPWFPPIPSRPDIFGLHHLSLIQTLCETDAERDQRITSVEDGVRAAFNAAVHHLGADQARELFKRMLRRPKRSAGKAHAPDRDARLLKAYDEAQGKESIVSLAKRLKAASNKSELGSTKGAIAAQIRKLVSERDQRRRAAAKEQRRWRMATRNDPPTILGAAIAREK